MSVVPFYDCCGGVLRLCAVENPGPPPAHPVLHKCEIRCLRCSSFLRGLIVADLILRWNAMRRMVAARPAPRWG